MAERKPFDWRLIAAWTILLAVSVAARSYVEMANQAKIGRPIGLDHALAIELTSHVVVAALLPALYWLHRRWPIGDSLRTVTIHVAAVVPFSIAHTVGMAALRLLWFSAILGTDYSFPLTPDRLAYEFAKDIVSYGMLSAGVLALRYLLDRMPQRANVAPQPVVRQEPAPAPVPEPPAGAPAPSSPPLAERFAVRKRGREIMVEMTDIDWVEASGNYAVLHVGGETLEIRSSLSKLEGELDPRRFVRVHKSYLVNVTRITEVTPWVSGDWRIRLQDGAEVNLSRRYRQRFESLVPVKS
ncbi:LytTR family DNA-binding domain-containing protein [Reyranella sp.]|uniref:LytTR family DNA-binding domain-containing protein n=1 Tax=Reyranella sp. TaxID=1929291 RepID=UPI003783C00B